MCYNNNYMERFLDYFKPHHYKLEECFWRVSEQLKGKVEITGALLSDSIKLHAVGLQIEKIEWRPRVTDHEGSSAEYGYMTCDFTHTDGVITIPVTAEMHAILDECQDENYLIIKVNFSGKLSHNMQGCYLSTYNFNSKEQRLVATQFESHYAREAFPCIDEPAAKATFDLRIIVPDYDPSCDVVLANTPVIQQTQGSFEFQTTPRMSTYLLAWVVGPLQSVSTVNKNGVKVSSYCAFNQSVESLLFANDTAARALEYYDEKFQEKYPLPKLDQVALPDFEAGAMENWGLVTYRESMMLADKTATTDTKQSIALTVTHELSHQWFGDLVTMQWWDDLWLNESFASVIEYFATDALYPDFNIWQDFFTGYCFAAFKRDCLPGVQSVQQVVHHPTEIATLFDSAIVYAKGAHLIFMLIRLMGEEKFDQGLRDYFDKYKYENTVGDNLWDALQPYADFYIKDFMRAWITQPGYPVLQRQGNEWEQHRFLITGQTDDTVWPLPEITDDMSGHYLLNLDDADFQSKIAEYDQLSQEQKLRLLIDRELLAKTPNVASASLFDLLPKFIHEPSSAVWNIILMLITDLKLFCTPETPATDDYKAYLRQLLQNQFDDIDFSVLHDVDSTTKRHILLEIARYSEYEPILRHLMNMYSDDFAKIDPELRVQVLAAKMYFDEDKVFTPWLKKYQTETDPEIKDDILYTLIDIAKQPEHLEQLLAWLEQPKIVRPQNHIFLFAHLMRNYRTRDRALDWLVTHWDYVEQLTGEKSIEDYPRLAATTLRTPAEAEKFYNFFDKMSDNPVLSRTLKIAHTDIDARLALIAKDSAGVHEKLKELVKGE